MTYKHALTIDKRIQEELGHGWLMEVIKLPDDTNVSVTWKKGPCHISCSLFDFWKFHFSISLHLGMTVTASGKDLRKIRLDAIAKAQEKIEKMQSNLDKAILNS